MHLKLNRIQYPVYNLGPGKRIALWVQGCSLGCTGCISPSLWGPQGGADVDVALLSNRIFQLENTLDGITITGGEPFEQYEPLIAFCSFIKRKTDLDVFVYSGYTLEELENRFQDRLFARFVDFLMDGRYQRSLHDNRNTRGSSNQRLYQFHNGEAVEQIISQSVDSWSIHVSQNSQVFMAGIPKAGELKSIRDELSAVGIRVRFV